MHVVPLKIRKRVIFTGDIIISLRIFFFHPRHLVTLGLKSVERHTNRRMPPHTGLLPQRSERCPERRRWREPRILQRGRVLVWGGPGHHQEEGRAKQTNGSGTTAPAHCHARCAPDAHCEPIQQCYCHRCCASVPDGWGVLHVPCRAYA